jgi:5-methylcytosine-specific restriction endonuclease McrA
MATKDKRDWKKEYQTQLKRGDEQGQLERQKARRLYDKKGIDRTNKNIDHIVPIKTGGKTKVGNLRLRSPKANKSDNKK